MRDHVRNGLAQFVADVIVVAGLDAGAMPVDALEPVKAFGEPRVGRPSAREFCLRSLALEIFDLGRLDREISARLHDAEHEREDGSPPSRRPRG